MIVLDFSVLIFVAIKNTTDYCNSLMDKVINTSIKLAKGLKKQHCWHMITEFKFKYNYRYDPKWSLFYVHFCI